jgi:small subunit ribosomal protein S17
MPRRVLEGEVVSDKMDKTVTVRIERSFMHPVYKKVVRKSDKYAAHDEYNAFKIGDRVKIEECRPISKRKSWTVITPVDASKMEAGKAASAAKMKAAPKKSAAKKEAAPKAATAVKAKVSAPKAEKAEKAPAKKPAAAKKATSKKKDAE